MTPEAVRKRRSSGPGRWGQGGEDQSETSKVRSRRYVAKIPNPIADIRARDELVGPKACAPSAHRNRCSGLDCSICVIFGLVRQSQLYLQGRHCQHLALVHFLNLPVLVNPFTSADVPPANFANSRRNSWEVVTSPHKLARFGHAFGVNQSAGMSVTYARQTSFCSGEKLSFESMRFLQIRPENPSPREGYATFRQFRKSRAPPRPAIGAFDVFSSLPPAPTASGGTARGRPLRGRSIGGYDDFLGPRLADCASGFRASRTRMLIALDRF
jgi:hypothetical protein